MIHIVLTVISIVGTLVSVGCAIYAVVSYVDLKKTVKKWEDAE